MEKTKNCNTCLNGDWNLPGQPCMGCKVYSNWKPRPHSPKRGTHFRPIKATPPSEQASNPLNRPNNPPNRPNKASNHKRKQRKEAEKVLREKPLTYQPFANLLGVGDEM
jgi:hypothetical protein